MNQPTPIMPRPGMKPLSITRHGIIQHYDAGSTIFSDEQSMYVDDQLDCFDIWEGNGSLKDFCAEQFAKEKTSMLHSPLRFQQPDMWEASMMILEKKIEILSTESDEGLKFVCAMYKRNSIPVIREMLRIARSGKDTFFVSAEFNW